MAIAFFLIFNFNKLCSRLRLFRKISTNFSKKVGSLWRKQFLVQIDEDFAINRIQPNFLSLLLTGKFRRGVKEVLLKRNLDMHRVNIRVKNSK